MPHAPAGSRWEPAEVQSAKLDAKSSTGAPFRRMLFAGLSIASAAVQLFRCASSTTKLVYKKLRY